MDDEAVNRRESERRLLAKSGECISLGNPIPPDEFNGVMLANHEFSDKAAGASMRFQCRALGKHVTLGFCELCHLFKPIRDPVNGQIVVVITTSPREPSTIRETFQSLRGWPDPITTFTNDTSGPYSAFYRGMTASFVTDPHVAGCLYLQDDVKLSDKTYDWLKDLLATADKAGMRFLVASPYRPASAVATNPRTDPMFSGLGEFCQHGWRTAGACSLFFTPAALRAFLSHPWVLRWRWSGEDGWRRIDQVVGAWAAQWGGIFYPHESLAEHIGHVSSRYKYNREGTGHGA